MTSIGRREFLAGASALALPSLLARADGAQAPGARAGAVFPGSVREDFPLASDAWRGHLVTTLAGTTFRPVQEPS